METDKKMKIVFIHPDLGIGGAERLVLDVAVALAEKGNEVSFVTNHFNKTHAFQELQEGHFRVRVIGNWIPRSICGICQALCAYIRMLFLTITYILFIRKKEMPDVYFVDQIPMAVPLLKLAGGKVVYYCHHPDLLASPPGGKLKKLYRFPIDWLELICTGLADIILVNSKYTASVFKKTFSKIIKDVQILYPTISLSCLRDVENITNIKSINELVPEIENKENQIIFLSINRFHPAKNLKLAINSFEVLRSKLSSKDWDRVHLILAGGYDPQSVINAKYFGKLLKLTQEKDLTTKVVFLKSLTDDLKANLLILCDCLIYTPSNEHFGIVPLEAMLAAKPVIACDSGGPCETIENGKTGYLCEANADSFAAAMVKILDKDQSSKMGIAGRKRLEKYFSYSVFVKSVNDVVRHVLNEPIKENNQIEDVSETEKQDARVTQKQDGTVTGKQDVINNSNASTEAGKSIPLQKEKSPEMENKGENDVLEKSHSEEVEENTLPQKEKSLEMENSENKGENDVLEKSHSEEVTEKQVIGNSTVSMTVEENTLPQKEKSPKMENSENKGEHEVLEKSHFEQVELAEIADHSDYNTNKYSDIPYSNQPDLKTESSNFLQHESVSK